MTWESGLTQAPCPMCDAPLDGSPHRDGCAWQAAQARLMQSGQNRSYGTDAMNACRVQDGHANRMRWPDMFPQQPEGPAPASWWSRVKGWLQR